MKKKGFYEAHFLNVLISGQMYCVQSPLKPYKSLLALLYNDKDTLYANDIGIHTCSAASATVQPHCYL